MKNRFPLVAICIPAYNRPEGLRKALTALTRQRYQNLEIHVSNDHSPDQKVEEIVQYFCAQDHRIKSYYQQENLGVIKNHQFLLSTVSSEAVYIMWACDDDHWHPDYIHVCVNQLEQYPEALLCTTQNSWIEGGRYCDIHHHERTHTLGIPEPEVRFKRILSNILWWNNTFYGVMRKSVYELVALKKHFAFDILFICQLSLQGEFIQVPELYFTKTIGGHGSTLQQNLKAVKVSGWLTRFFPRMNVLLRLTQMIIDTSSLTFFNKIKLLIQATVIIGFSKIYGDSIIEKCMKILNYLIAELKILRIWSKIGDFSIARLINAYQIPLDELRFSKKDQLLYSDKIGIALNDTSTLYEGYHELADLKTQLQATFEYRLAQKMNVVTIDGVSLHLRMGYYSYLLNEVFSKETYGFDFSQPSIVIDIGTNVGVAALYFARQAHVKKVYGFEPFKETAEAALENFELNPTLKSKIQLANYGLSNRSEVLSVDYSFGASQLINIQGKTLPFSKHISYEKATIEITKATEALSNILSLHLDEQMVLKIDTEGSEFDIVQDLYDSGLLSRFNLIMLEWHGDGDELLKQLLRSSHFSVCSVNKNYSSMYGNTGMVYAVNLSKEVNA